MTVNNKPNALPSVALVVFRQLKDRPEGQSPSDLVASIAPPAAVGRTPEEGTSNQVQSTIDLLVEFGILTEVQGRLRLPRGAAPNPKAGPDVPDAEILGRLVLTSFLDPQNNGITEEELWASDQGSRDFTRGIAWFLMQDPWTGPYVYEGRGGIGEAQNDQLRADERRKQPLFSTSIRWDAFSRWAVFTGLARKDMVGLIPDPTTAIADVLSQHTPGSRRAGQFLSGLATSLPVVDGGSYWRAVEARRSSEAPFRRDHSLSPSLTHSLLRLRDRGLISLENRADAPDKVALARVNEEARREVVSHIRVLP
jgi:hypothetical protein